MKIPYNILIQIKMSVRPYFKGFTLIFSSITVENRILLYNKCLTMSMIEEKSIFLYCWFTIDVLQIG